MKKTLIYSKPFIGPKSKQNLNRVKHFWYVMENLDKSFSIDFSQVYELIWIQSNHFYYVWHCFGWWKTISKILTKRSFDLNQLLHTNTHKIQLQLQPYWRSIIVKTLSSNGMCTIKAIYKRYKLLWVSFPFPFHFMWMRSLILND